MALMVGSSKVKCFIGENKVKKIFLGAEKMYSAGSIVTYNVDNNVSYQEEVDEGLTVLSPQTFTPSKSGWTFVGWREDNTANSSVLSSKTMGDEPITLYAVFKAGVTVTYYNNSTTASTTSKDRIYNNGNVVNPTFNLTQATSSGWSTRGWSTTNSGNAAITYASGANFTRDSNITLYGLYQRTLTLTYYDNSTTAKTTSGINYWAPAGHIYPSFKMTQTNSSGWTCRGWSTTNSGSAGITYANGATISISGNTTIYGLYQQTITVTYYNNSSSASTTTGTRYWAPAGYINPTFKLTVATVSGWSIRGWSTASGANAGITYNSNTNFTRDSNCTLYASWSRTVTLSYNGNGQTGGSTAASTGTAYRGYKGDTINASIALRGNGFSKTNYSFYRWRAGSTSGTIYAAGATYSTSSDTTFYAYWITTTTSFGYTGGMQSFTALAGVTYTLKVWGAQGGNCVGLPGNGWAAADGGKGGYAQGNYRPGSNTTLYVCVGGQPGRYSYSGGYNGGGQSYPDDRVHTAGGGATHIGLTNTVLKSTSKSNVLIVGGGGGGGSNGGTSNSYTGGTGGGTNGGNGGNASSSNGGYGGSQSAGGSTGGGFGYGGGSSDQCGGGGGFYGGGTNKWGGGGGGSGYIGAVSGGSWGKTSDLRSGNGYAQIIVASV